ncbi:GTP cyclohydrolase FolE2 [bacterium]|nr:GTP cyclohydrolase FolE2 [bacterium]
MKDVQSSYDSRGIPIDRVGVKGLRYPIKVLQRDNGLQSTIAEISIFVDLHPNFRGTHMSRFVEIIDNVSGEEITIHTIPKLLQTIKNTLKSNTAEIEIWFPYFIRKRAPVSGKTGLLDYQCHFRGRFDGRIDFVYGVKVPITSLCPCSKEISNRGAHNQRGLVSLDIRSEEDILIWFEELIEIIELNASAPIYSLLKREDEKFVTEQAYDNPKFVEDLVRNIALKLQKDERIKWFSVSAENIESIHNHNAFAFIER